MNPKGISALPATLIIFTILALGIVGYFSWTAKQSAISSLSTVSTELTNDHSNTNTAANSNADVNTNTINNNTSTTIDASGNTNVANVNANPDVNATVDVTKDWKTYTNYTIGFTFKYPENYELRENPDVGENPKYVIGLGPLNSPTDLNFIVFETDKVALYPGGRLITEKGKGVVVVASGKTEEIILSTFTFTK